MRTLLHDAENHLAQDCLCDVARSLRHQPGSAWRDMLYFSAVPKRTCIFCGGTPLTKEHLHGHWASRFSDQEHRDILQRTDREYELPEPSDTRRWRARAYDRQASVVCRACNGGWMSDLETAVSALLDPGELDGKLLSSAQQTSLATWAMKSALTMDAAQSPVDRVIPMEMARRFGRDRRLPESAQVWIASYIGGEDQMPAFAGIGIDLDDRQDSRRGWRDIAVITFVTGPFVFQVFVTIESLGRVVLTRAFPPGPHIAQIWPVQESALWRREPGLDVAGVIAFAEQIPTALRGSILIREA